MRRKEQRPGDWKLIILADDIFKISQDARMPPAAKFLFVVLCCHANWNKNKCYIRHKILAQESGMSSETVRRNIRLLCQHGYVQRKIQPGRKNCNEYIISGKTPIVCKDDNSQNEEKKAPETTAQTDQESPAKLVAADHPIYEQIKINNNTSTTTTSSDGCGSSGVKNEKDNNDLIELRKFLTQQKIQASDLVFDAYPFIITNSVGHFVVLIFTWQTKYPLKARLEVYQSIRINQLPHTPLYYEKMLQRYSIRYAIQTYSKNLDQLWKHIETGEQEYQLKEFTDRVKGMEMMVGENVKVEDIFKFFNERESQFTIQWSKLKTTDLYTRLTKLAQN